MKLKVLLAATLAVAVAAPAMAGDDNAQQQQTAAKEKKVCRTETVTGSLIAKRRICKTQAEWDEIAANTRKTMGDMNRHENMGSEGGSANGANNGAGFGF